MDLTSYLSGQMFTKAYRVLRSHVLVCLEQYDLSMTEWWLLGLINNQPAGLRLNEVALELHVKAPHVTMMADALAKRGFLQRAPHRSDGRAKLLTITPAGAKLLNTIDLELSHVMGYLLRGVPNNDLTAYQRVLDTIIANG